MPFLCFVIRRNCKTCLFGFPAKKDNCLGRVFKKEHINKPELVSEFQNGDEFFAIHLAGFLKAE